MYHGFTTEVARDVKEMWCYIALDGYTERKSTAEMSDKEKTYEIPVGIIIILSSVRFRCFESKTSLGRAKPNFMHECQVAARGDSSQHSRLRVRGRLLDYGKKSKVSVTVWVCPQIGTANVEPYSTIFSTLALLEYTDGSVIPSTRPHSDWHRTGK